MRKTGFLKIAEDMYHDCLDLFYPVSCACCGRQFHTLDGVCVSCWEDIPHIHGDRCTKCGKQLEPYSGENTRCNVCRTVHYYFRNTYALCRYESPVREMLHSLKYGRDFSVVPAFRRIIKNGMCLSRAGEYDCTVPVPLFFIDRLCRGFNQSAVFARYAAKLLGIACVHVLKKKRATHTQVSLSRAERRKNLENAFSCRRHVLKGKTVLLVDDVFTTGSTLSECAKMLRKKGGAVAVDTLVIAR